MRITGAVLTVLLIALPTLSATDVDGNWLGTVRTPFGDVQIGFTFKTDGSTLTGTMTEPNGTLRAISNGKIDGNNLTFEVSSNGASPTLSYIGVLDGDHMNLSWEVQGQPRHLVVRKVK